MKEVSNATIEEIQNEINLVKEDAVYKIANISIKKRITLLFVPKIHFYNIRVIINMTNYVYTSLAAPGTLAHHLQRSTAYKIQNSH